MMNLRRSMFGPQSATFRQETEMADNSLRALHATHNTEDPVQRLRLLCLSRGASGFLDLGRLFRRMDEDGNRKLNLEGFISGLRGIGLEITDHEAKDMFEIFDTDGTGSLNMEEFLEQLRSPLSESRKNVIEEAFLKMDKSRNGVITTEELRKTYNVNSDPRYISGEDSKESIFQKFLGHFEEDSTKDGIVTKEEFLNYYAAISASIDNDCYFNLIMRQAYKL